MCIVLPCTGPDESWHEIILSSNTVLAAVSLVFTSLIVYDSKIATTTTTDGVR